VLISTVNADGSLDFCSSPFFTDRTILTFTLSPTVLCPSAIHWDSVFSLDFIYVDSLTFSAYGVSFAGPRQAFPQLALTKIGPGTIASSPAGVSCGPTCSTAVKSFARGSTVTLTATPSAGAIFLGWTGACSGTGKTCTFTMSDDRFVGAAFGASPQARFLNDICFRPAGSPTCNAFTATLKSTVGATLTWSSSTLVPSPYQIVPSLTITGFSAFLPPTSATIIFSGAPFILELGRKYTFQLDLINGSFVLTQFDTTAGVATPGGVAVRRQTLPPGALTTPGADSRFGPASGGP
jgi:List-Bact-rpt repeat protein